MSKGNLENRFHDRVRERGTNAPKKLSVKEFLKGSPNNDNGLKGTYLVCGDPVGYQLTADRVVVDFVGRQARGEVMFNPFRSYTRTSASSSLGPSCRDVSNTPNKGSVYSCEGDWLRYLLSVTKTSLRVSYNDNWGFRPIQCISERALSAALAEASTKSAQIPNDASLLVSIAEFKQTLSLLPDIIHSWTGLLSRINSRYQNKFGPLSRYNPTSDWRTAKVVLDGVRDELAFLNDLWLATRFGLLPSISDSVGVVKALGRTSETLAVRHTTRGAALAFESGSSTAQLVYGVTLNPVTEQTNDNFSVRAMCLWEGALSMLDNLGLNVANAPVALVDLTRFSFVLNWMVNVNDFASAIGSSLQPGWQKLGGCVVSRRETSTVYTSSGTVVAPLYASVYAVNSAMSGSLTVVERSVTRVPGVPKTSLTIRADPFHWVRDFRLVDAVALFVQQAKGKGVQRMFQLSKMGLSSF